MVIFNDTLKLMIHWNIMSSTRESNGRCTRFRIQQLSNYQDWVSPVGFWCFVFEEWGWLFDISD